MLNVAKGVFKSRLPVPLVKEIIILPVEEQQEQIKQFDIIVKVLVQTTSKNYNSAFNLSVSAITSQKQELLLNQNPQIIKNFVFSQSGLTKNIKINNLSEEGSRSYYDKTQDSELYTKIINVPMSINSVGSLEHLSILCFTNSTVQRGDVKSPELSLIGKSFNISRPVIDRVKTLGALSRTSQIYKLLDTVPEYGKAGDVWVGPVHLHPQDGLMVEENHVSRPHPRIESVQVPNQKIKDYRTGIVNSIIKDRQRASSSSTSYFAPIQYARAKDGSLKIHTSFNFLQYVKNEGALSHLFDNNFALLSTVELLDIKVYRKKVDTTNFGNFLTPVYKFENQSITERSTRRLVGTLEDNSVRIIQTNSQDLSLEVLPILIVDSQIKDETEGYYNYEIEVNINDNTAKVISDMATKLKDKITIAQSYNLKFNNYGKTNYDVEANTLAREKELKADNSWKGALEEYVSILQFMFGSKVGPIPVNLLARNMFSFASPYSASEESLSEFNKVINDFIQIMFETTTKATGNLHKKQSFNSSIAGATPLVRKLKYLSNIEKNYFNNMSRETGYDYLGASVTRGDLGLSRLSFSQFQSRVGNEVEKYEVSSPNSININKFGYLSPNEISTNTTKIKVEKQIDFNKSLDLLEANENPSTMSKNFKVNSAMESGQTDPAESLLGLSGVTLVPKGLKLKDLNKSQVSARSLDSSKFLSSNSEFSKEDNSYEASVSGSKESKIKQQSTQRQKYVNTGIVQFMLQQKATEFKAIKATNIEQISGSLAYSKLTEAPDSFESLNVLEKNINFNSIVKVEYSTGNGDNWETLNTEKFNAMKTSNDPVLCRITKPNDVLNVSNKFKLDSYDQLFVLGDGDLNFKESNINSDIVMNNIKKSVTKLFSDNINNKAAGSAVMSQYLTGQVVVRQDRARNVVSSNRQSSGTSQGY